MKKIALTLIFLFTLVSFSFGQITFNKTFQLDTFALYSPSTEFYSVQEDGKFIYVLGTYHLYYSTTGTTTSFILTLSQNGNILHQKNLEQVVIYNNLVPIENDGLALVSNLGDSDSILILKTYPLSDTSVTIKKSMGTAPFTAGFKRLSITTDKYFLVAGIGTDLSSNSSGDYGEFYMKLDSMGNVIWNYIDMSSYPERKHSVNLQELKNGNYLLIGNRRYKDYNSNDYESQGFFKILDTSGVTLSTVYTDNNELLLLGRAISFNDGSIVFLGTERKTFGHGSSYFDYGGYICKYDSTHQLLWQYSMGNRNYPSDIIKLEDDSFIVLSSKQDTLPNYNNFLDSIKSYGTFLKLAPDGTKIWERKFTIFDSLSVNRNLYSITQATNGDFISVGRALYSSNQGSHNSGWIIRTDSFGCIVPGCQILDNTENQTFDDINQLTVFPNPTSDLITFRFEKLLNNASIRIFNSLGQEMKIQQITDNQQQINCSNWQNGLYFYGIYENNRLVKTGQFLKQH